MSPAGKAKAAGAIAAVAAIDALAYAGALPRWTQFHGFDLLAHFVLLGLTALSADRLCRGRTIAGRLPLGPALVAALALGDEWLQSRTPVRNASLADALANLAGIVAFTWAGRASRGDATRV